MNVSYVWTRIFPFPRTCLRRQESDPLDNVCRWIVRAHQERRLCNSSTSNLMRRMKIDYRSEKDHWDFISQSANYDDFLLNLSDYTKIRESFPSRDKQPADPACFPLSNEKMYGKGINSRVRD